MADDYCNNLVQYVDENEYIGDSLNKINNNFTTLLSASCELEKRLDNIVNVRTFFYYGPNTPTSTSAGTYEGDNNPSYPSVQRIQDFVNNIDQLNLPSISEIGDVAYVIYQKTGWYNQQENHYRNGSGVVSYTYTVKERYSYTVRVKVKISRWRSETRWGIRYVTRVGYKGFNWSTVLSDNYRYYTPVFVIYKLTFNGTTYTNDGGYPKFTRASSANTTFWNMPQNWSIY